MMKRKPYFKIINNLYEKREKNETTEINLISKHKKEINSNFDEGKMFLMEKENNKTKL